MTAKWLSVVLVGVVVALTAGAFIVWFTSPVQECIRTCDASMGEGLTPYFHEMHVEMCEGPNYWRGDAGTTEVLQMIQGCKQ